MSRRQAERSPQSPPFPNENLHAPTSAALGGVAPGMQGGACECPRPRPFAPIIGPDAYNYCRQSIIKQRILSFVSQALESLISSSRFLVDMKVREVVFLCAFFALLGIALGHDEGEPGMSIYFQQLGSECVQYYTLRCEKIPQ
jgi:hypothetical protein